MLWKIIVGALLIVGALEESANILKATVSDDGSLSIPAVLGILTLFIAGIFLLVKGYNERKSKTK